MSGNIFGFDAPCLGIGEWQFQPIEAFLISSFLTCTRQ